MKEVILYTIEEKVLHVGSYQECIERISLDVMRVMPFTGGNFAIPEDPTTNCKVERIPIQYIQEWVENENVSYYPPDNSKRFRKVEKLIAVEPKLRAYIENPLLDEITELKESLRDGVIQLRLARSVLLEIESKKKRNVFRRIIDAIKNESIPTWQTHS